MSKCESQLRHFLRTAAQEPVFPRETLAHFVNAAALQNAQFLAIYQEFWNEYLTNLQQYRQITILLFIGLSKNLEGALENAMQFIEGMIVSRLVMLMFSPEGELLIDRVLLYLEPTLELAVLKGLQGGKEGQLVTMLQRVNSKERKFNEIGFILEMTFIRKVQKYLEDQSLEGFNQLLKGILSSPKMGRLSHLENSLHFRHIAILRQEEDRQENYYLQLINGGKLLKMKETLPANSLPHWVQQAFWKMPRALNLQDFRAISVSKVFSLLCEVEVFASSPLIEEFDCYTRQQIFLSIFQQFLMGLSISHQPYEFQWQKMRKSLDLIHRSTQSQNNCYMSSVIEQVLTTYSSSIKGQLNKKCLF